MIYDNTPVLVACAQITDKSNDPSGPTPIELMTRAALAAEADSGVATLLSQVDSIACTGLTVDEESVSNPLSGSFSNVPKSVANQLGISPQNLYYSTTGGNTPQQMVHHFAQKLAQGECETVMICGGEALHTMRKKFDHWSKVLLPKGKWREKPGGQATMLGKPRACGTKHEALYDLNLPANVYPLFENALRIHYQRTQAEHHAAMGEIFSSLTQVAAGNPNAWFNDTKAASELITPSSENRMIAFPYTKYLNSMIYVNQAAAVILTTVAKAKALGIDSDRFVYLHGFADTYDIWNVSERENYHSSPGMRDAGKRAMSMANTDIDSMGFFDIYSCFPSAVQIACDEFGLSQQDSRGLSLTGGLPYFGGAGNSYSLLAIAQMMDVLRENPGEFGLLNANGWFLTKHSVGIYSTREPQMDWRATASTSLPTEVAADKAPEFIEQAQGPAQLETFTVIHDKMGNPKKGIMFGRLDNQQRFLAEVAGGVQALESLMNNDDFTIRGHVETIKRINRFTVD
ncbi:MAG: acetyl-CoA C-acetyltransferase [Cryomorphaceae bacterium]|jgi:acetyl-CoA C-acetyltransferase